MFVFFWVLLSQFISKKCRFGRSSLHGTPWGCPEGSISRLNVSHAALWGAQPQSFPAHSSVSGSLASSLCLGGSYGNALHIFSDVKLTLVKWNSSLCWSRGWIKFHTFLPLSPSLAFDACCIIFCATEDATQHFVRFISSSLQQIHVGCAAFPDLKTQSFWWWLFFTYPGYILCLK